MPKITVRGPVGAAVAYTFDEDVVTMGRASSAHLTILDPALSRLHAEIRREDAGWMIADLGSMNGTRVNGVAVREPRVLSPGDEITLGETLLVFEADVPDAVSSNRVTQPNGWAYRGNGRARPGPRLVGGSRAIRSVLEMVERVGRADVSVLVLGENGTGKELVARLVHLASARAAAPFVVVNCPALPGTLLEAELFGVERGAATGVEARTGRLELAQGGTILLDEVGDMDPAAQAKILRFLQDHAVERLGGTTSLPLDVRVIAATNHDLRADIDRGTFRRDLFHRLNTVTITLPPLRERRDDIPALVRHFLAAAGAAETQVSDEAMALLQRYDFPGNVRELHHVIERALVLCDTPLIRPEHLPDEVRLEFGMAACGARGADPVDALYDRAVARPGAFWDVVAEPYLRRQLTREEARVVVLRAYEKGGGSYKGMAQLLGIDGEYKRLLNFVQYHRLGVSEE